MQNKALKYLLLALMVAIIVPQIAMASWWNPFSWGIWNRVFHFKQTEQKQEQKQEQQNPVACTMDAKLCPDGSYVGREGPKCEFKACPEVKVETPKETTANWKTYTNSEYGFEIKYPSTWFYRQYSWGPKLSGAFGKGIAFCPVGKYNEQNCTVEPMMNTPVAPIFINTGTEPVISSSLILSEDGQIYKDTYNQMLSTFKFTNNQLGSLSEESIVEAVENLEHIKLKKNERGFYEYSSLPQGFGLTVDSITSGDINGDGLGDAFIHITTCGASCGSGFVVVINKDRGTYEAFSVIPDGFILSGAAQYGVKSVSITSGIISINVGVSNPSGSTSTVTLKYKLSGKNLEKVN